MAPPGALKARADGRLLSLVANGDLDEIKQRAQALRALSADAQPLSLRELFLESVGEQHSMIWYKAWLESCARFLVAATLIAVVVGWAILNHAEAMLRMELSPSQYTQFVWPRLRAALPGSVGFRDPLPRRGRAAEGTRARHGAVHTVPPH